MAQFEVYRLRGGTLAVDLQTDLIGLDATRLVAPLLKADRHASFPGLTPHARLDGEEWIVRLQQAAAIGRGEIAETVGSLAHLRDEIQRGLDILIDGV